MEIDYQIQYELEGLCSFHRNLYRNCHRRNKICTAGYSSLGQNSG